LSGDQFVQTAVCMRCVCRWLLILVLNKTVKTLQAICFYLASKTVQGLCIRPIFEFILFILLKKEAIQ